MRFAYIDSNGNEVPIPSVDALALRIELGAISENTQLYDAQADEWGPAHSHEIYHTLLRAKESGDGFIAPPPVAPPPVAPPSGKGAPAAVEGPAAPEPAPADPEEEPEEEDTSFGLTLADPPPEPPAGKTPADSSDAGEDPVLGLEPAESPAANASPELAPLDLAPERPPLEEGESAAHFDDESGAFDFGGMDGGLELEASFESPPDEAPMDFSPPDAGPVPDFTGGLDSGGDGFGGMGLETASEFSSGGFEMDSGDALDLEKPMSEFTPEAPPAWMDDEADDSGDGEVLDFSSVGGDSSEDVPLRDRRTPKNRPSPPKLRRRSLTGPLVGAVALVAVGVGAYSAWPLISERLAARGAGGEDEVFLPPLPDDLMPTMREAADATFAALFERARTEWAAGGPVQAPPTDWLSGIYLARASEYGAAEDFWLGMRDFLESVQSTDLATFDAAYVAELGRRDVGDAEAPAIRERADSGFVAAADARAAAFGQLGTAIDAAIRLHEFLVANEANIEYAPASAVTTDPVLEVNPASEEIRAAMDQLIDAVTRSLVAMGYRDQVTAAGLRAVLLERVQEAGIR